MKKEQFLNKLKEKLNKLPKEEIESRINYYDEIISDRLEDGCSEKEAIKALGNIDEIVNNIMLDMSIPTLMKARIKESKKTLNKTLWIILAIIGFPLWLPILASIFFIILSVYIVLWSAILSLYVTNFALGISGIVMFISGIVLSFTETLPLGLCTVGMGIASVGISILLIKPCIIVAKKIIKATAWVGRKIKSFIIVKEDK